MPKDEDEGKTLEERIEGAESVFEVGLIDQLQACKFAELESRIPQLSSADQGGFLATCAALGVLRNRFGALAALQKNPIYKEYEQLLRNGRLMDGRGNYLSNQVDRHGMVKLFGGAQEVELKELDLEWQARRQFNLAEKHKSKHPDFFKEIDAEVERLRVDMQLGAEWEVPSVLSFSFCIT